MFGTNAQQLNQRFENLSEEDFRFFQELIFNLAGISLTEKKADLVKSRIRSYAQKCNISSFEEYRLHLTNAKPGGPEIQKFINLLTTNKTDFFREPQHFEYLKGVLIPHWIDKGLNEVNVWCCASSTGEEPYTLALVLNRYLPERIKFRVLATDIDTEVLNKGRNGVYSVSKIPEIPEDYRNKHLVLGRKSANGWFKFDDQIHDKITFAQHNLNKNNLPSGEKFDLIFCRNVLIYFSPPTIRTLIEKLHRQLVDDGYLFIGHSESIQGSGHLFKTLKPSIFAKI